jgi:hypothetical protein
MPPPTTHRPSRHPLPAILLALPFLLTPAACDNSSSSNSTPAATTTAPPPTPVTADDLLGDWTFDPADIRAAAFNSLLAQAARDGRADEFTDRQIEQHVPQRVQLMLQNPITYTFARGGAFSAAAGPDNTVTGTWTLEGNTVTITSETVDKPIRFELTPGELRGIAGEDTRRRPVNMLRK